MKLLLTHRVLSHTKVLLAKRKRDGKYYAIKVLQKKVILNRREVMTFFVLIPTLSLCSLCYVLWHLINEFPWNVLSRQQKHIMAERNVLLKNVKHPFLVGLHYSFQTTDKLYFVLDFVNGGEVSICGWEAQGWRLPYQISQATIWQIKPICYKYSYCWCWQWHLSLYDFLKGQCTQK